MQIPIAVLLMCAVIIPTLQAQPFFSMGSRYAAGISPNHVNATYPSNTTITYPQYNFSRGVTFEYLFTNTIGFQSAIQTIVYGYSAKKSFPASALTDPSIDIIDLQVPFLLVLQKRHRFVPFRIYKILLGTSVDVIYASYVSDHTPALWLKNIIADFRICTEKLKHGRLEFGVEYQNSPDYFTLNTKDMNSNPVVLTTKLNLINLTIHYFFLKKNFNPTTKDVSE